MVHRPAALAIAGDVVVALEAWGGLARSCWRLSDGALLSHAQLASWPPAPDVLLSPDGSRTVRSSRTGRFEVWDGDRERPRLITVSGRWFPLAFTRDGRRIVAQRFGSVRGADGADSLDVIDLKRGVVVASLRGGHPVAWAPDGRSLLTYRKGLRRWSMGGGEGAALDPKSSLDLAFIADDRVVRLGRGALDTLRFEGDRVTREATFPHPFAPGDLPRIVHADAHGVVASSWRGRRTAVWAFTFAEGRWTRLGDVACELGPVASDGVRAVAADRNALVCWDLATGAETRWHRGFGGGARAVAVRGPRVAAHDGEGDLRVFDARDLAETWGLEPATPRKDSRPDALCFGHDARSLYAITRAEGVVRWDLTTGALVATGGGAPDTPEGLAVAPDERVALTWKSSAIRGEPAIRRVDLRGKPRRVSAKRTPGRTLRALDARFGPDGAPLILWDDVDTGRVFAAGPSAATAGPSFERDGVHEGALGASGSFAMLTFPRAPRGAPARVGDLVWVAARGAEGPAVSIRVNPGALVAFAGECLVVCDGEGWGLWRRTIASMERVASLESDGGTATALAFDEETGLLVVGTAEGTLVTFALREALGEALG